MPTATENKQFIHKVWTAAGIFAFVVVILLILKSIFSVLLLLLAGAIIAIYFRGTAGILERYLHLSSRFSLPVSIAGSILLLLLFFWLTGRRIQIEAQELSNTLPAAFEQFKQQLNASALGRKVLEKISSDETMNKAGGIFQQFFRSTFGVLADIYIIFLVGIFFTISPGLYTRGAVMLVPQKGRAKAEEIFSKLGVSLKKWLKGQIMAMGFVALLSAIGLIILGVPMWLILALMAGLLNFIPNFGPLIALIPAVLVGWMQDGTTAIIIAIMYTVIQILESSLITPKIQQKLLSIPPALLITVQVLMGVLTGGWGIILATPILVIFMVVVRELYIKPQNAKV